MFGYSDSDGRAETLALARAYPNKISNVRYHAGDWAVFLDGQWFHWANGRLLPEAERHRWEEFTRYDFERYEPGLPQLRAVDAQTEARFRLFGTGRITGPPIKYSTFLDVLYNAGNRSDTFQQIVPYTFVGFRTQVHRDLVPFFDLVAAELNALSARDPEAAEFLDQIRLISSFSWRAIAGTATRSYHSYGAAIDFIPYTYDRKHAYWRWAMEAGVEEWWAVPYERRWMPPLSVVGVFEEAGFVWGGKWLTYDTIHFEYRPEIRILSRLQSITRTESIRSTADR